MCSSDYTDVKKKNVKMFWQESFSSVSFELLFVCLFVRALDSEIQLWVGPCCGVQPLAQGVSVFVTPLPPHLRRALGGILRPDQS